MKQAAKIKLPFSEFWELTPYEFNLKVEEYYESEKEELKKDVTLAYLNSLWTIQWLGKKQPKPLAEILGDLHEEKKKETMTSEQMLAQAMALNTLFGGEVIYCQGE